MFARGLARHVELFKPKGNGVYNFRCNICNDSQKNKLKARAYLREHNGSLQFNCFNCGVYISFSSYLYRCFPTMYREFQFECLKTQSAEVDDNKTADQSFKMAPVKFSAAKLKKISQLHHDHPAKLYILSRKIPPAQHYRILYCPKFYQWTNSLIPGKFSCDLEKYDHDRIIFPLVASDQNIFGYQGRALVDLDNTVRYITIMLDQTKPKLFGMDVVHTNNDYFIVEGPIDSLFVLNCLAMVGSDINMADIPNHNNATFIFDNEPRNIHIVSKIQTKINQHYKVVLWPDSICSKDINDIVMHEKLTQHQLMCCLQDNTYSGPLAQLRFNQWKKV